ncbi:MAG: small subunit ribosomal protein S1, partial [Bacteroidia bacterium]
MLFFSLLYLILRPLKGGHIELTEQNNELESNALSNNPVDAKDATTEETTNASQELESTPETVKEEVAQSEESESEATPQAVVTSDEDATVEEVGTNTSQELESTPEPVQEVVAPSEKSESKASPKAVINSDDEEDDEDEDKTGTKNYKNVPDPVHDENAFDWTMDKEGFGKYDDSNKSELEQLYMDSFNSIEEGTIIKGIVVSLSKKDVIVNVGFKSDGLVSRTEFKDRPELAVGDEVQVYVVETEDALGQLVLSRKKAQAETAWENIILAQTDGSIVTGLIKSRTKGGLVVDIMGLDAFLPGSQIDVKPIRDYDQYVGQRMEFKVVKINEAFKNVVISHKALIEDDIEAQKGEILSKLEKGQVLEGVVKNMTSFGVFIDLGGLDGLLHITDVSWGRINHPEEVLQLDQKINIVVLDFDDDKKRISLGLKQLTPHPWDNLSDKLEVNAKVKGKVVTVADYGAFIEIAPGIEGLIHVSEMSWSQHLRNPQDFMNVGDEVEAVILTLEKEEHKMSLGIKQLTPDPWDNIEEKYPA